MAPIAAALAALASHFSAIAPAKAAAIPIAAGLAIGTAAGATFLTSAPAAETVATTPAVVASAAPVAPEVQAPAVAAPAMSAPAKDARPCDAQTWPYIDAKCRLGGAAGDDRKVRFVIAPRRSDMPTEAEKSSDAARATNPGLVSSSTVLYTPQAAAPEPKVRAKRETRRERQRRYATQNYQVPSEYRDQRGRAVIVVRPMRMGDYRY
jgi:hypothetical protein